MSKIRNKEGLFEPDRISTIINALDIYIKQFIPSIVDGQREEELNNANEIKDFLKKVIDRI